MNPWSNFTVFDNSVQNIEWNPAIEKLFYPPNEAKIYGGAYQLKVEPRGDILTVLAELSEENIDEFFSATESSTTENIS